MPNDVRSYGLDKGFDASAAVTKYQAVKLVSGTPETVAPVSAVGDTPIGIAMESVSAGEITKGKGVPVALSGQMPFKAGATVCHEGDQLVLGVLANGTLVPLGTGGAGTLVVAVCVLAAASGGYGSCRWML